MKIRTNLSFLFVLLFLASAPARADILTALLIDVSSNLLSKASRAVVSTVKEAVVPKESVQEKAAREKDEINRAADQILSQYAEELREEMRPMIVDRLTMIYAQHTSMENRQRALRADQDSLGNTLLDSTFGAVSGALGNHLAIDSAARAASIRSRY